MKVVKYICDKCGKEINGSVMAIVPEILDEGQDHLRGIHGSTGGRSGNTST